MNHVDAQILALHGGMDLHGLAADLDGTLVSAGVIDDPVAGDDVEQCALAGAVDAHETKDLSLFQFQIHVPQDAVTAEGLAHPA